MDKLIDKSYKTYDYVSRYSGFPYYYDKTDEKYIYGTTSHLNTETPYVIHTIAKGDTLDTLALDYYNNPTFYWIIADFNRIRDPYIKLVVGSQIKIPSFSSIEFIQRGV